jgi:uncharacterized repeat protein (TIGR01451 family)
MMNPAMQKPLSHPLPDNPAVQRPQVQSSSYHPWPQSASIPVSSADGAVAQPVPERLILPGRPALAGAVRLQASSAEEDEPTPFARVNTTWDSVDGWFGPGVHVWFDVYDSDGTHKGGGEGYARTDPDGAGWLDGVGCGCNILPGDQVVVMSETGFTGELWPLAISGHIDTANDQVAGVIVGADFPANGAAWAWSEGRYQGFDGVIEINEDDTYLADFSGFDLQAGDMVEIWYFDENGNHLGATLFGLLIQANYAHDWFSAYTEPLAEVTIEVAGKAILVASADEHGELRGWEWYDQWDPSAPDIAPGDVITASAAGFSMVINPVGEISGDLDLEADTISGVVQAPWLGVEQIHLRCEGWFEGGLGIEMWVDPNGGSYTCDFGSKGIDLQEGMDVAVRYFEPDSDQVINVFQVPRLDLRVNYGHDWVESFFPADHTIWITVTDSEGTFKASAEVFTQPQDMWGGQPGFQTRAEDWSPEPPDLQAGDWVYGEVDSGQTAQVQLGEIAGVIDLENDSIQGTISAGWFLSDRMVDVECFPWGSPDPNTPMKYDQVLPDGADPYDCSWAGEWDVMAGQWVGVGYFGPDHHWVANAFGIPDLQVWTWGDGAPGVGGNFTFNINYQNNSEFNSPDTTITTVLTNATWLSDTSGVTPTIVDNTITWQLGDLAPWSYGKQFQVFVSVDGSAGGQTGIAVDLATSILSGTEPWAVHSEWSAEILANETNLNVGKWPWTWDPVPGGEFVYAVNVCNNGATASDELILTDTLSEYTTLLYWWAQHPGWQVQSFADHHLVLSRPSLPGYWCSEVYLRVLLDVEAEGKIINQADVFSESDVDHGDDETSVTHGTGSPHVNLFLGKDWQNGVMTPGGEIGYEINSENQGNVPVNDVWFKGTLPEGTELIGVWAYTGQWGFIGEVFPTINGEEIEWQQAVMDNGYRYNYVIWVRISPDALPGAPQDMTMEIQAGSPMSMAEDNLWDNAVAWHDVVHPFGPNLRLDIHTNYHWSWQGRLGWEIRVMNRGSEWLENVAITDFLPPGTTFDGWGQNHGPETWIAYDELTNQAVFTISALNPGETASLSIYLRLDEGLVGLQGMAFANHVSAPISGDVDPADNDDWATAYTGPDFYAEKELISGTAKPGGTLKFRVHLGNANKWPWETSEGANVQLMEMLPKGVTFKTVYWPDGSPFEPSTNNTRTGVVTWDLGRVWPGEVRWFYVELQLAKNAPVGKTLQNMLQIREQPPAPDRDPVGSNNIFIYRIKVVR